MTKILSLCNVFRWHSGDQLSLGPKWQQNTTSPPWGTQPITALSASDSLPVSLSIHRPDWQAPDTPVSHSVSLSPRVSLSLSSVWRSAHLMVARTAQETGKSQRSVKPVYKQIQHINVWTHSHIQTHKTTALPSTKLLWERWCKKDYIFIVDVFNRDRAQRLAWYLKPKLVNGFLSATTSEVKKLSTSTLIQHDIYTESPQSVYCEIYFHSSMTMGQNPSAKNYRVMSIYKTFTVLLWAVFPRHRFQEFLYESSRCLKRTSETWEESSAAKRLQSHHRQ